MSVLVTGGAGYIGSHTVVELLSANKDVVIVDNFSNSKKGSIDRIEKIVGKKVKLYELDVCDEKKLDEVFKKENIDSVIHFAGFKAVGESSEKPLEYYMNNIFSTLSLVKIMRANNVKNLVFSSSATVYGKPDSVPITEEARLTATNPYGRTKLYIEYMLKDIFNADKTLNIALLRYFNPIGAHPSGLIGEDPNGIPNNLMPYITQVAIGKLKQLRVFGDDYDTVDGTGVRDYIHVVDLAKGHLLALNKLEKDGGLRIYNLGTGRGTSVLEMVQAFEKASGKKVSYEIVGRRAGDIDMCYADSTKAKEEMGFECQKTVLDMCKDSWNFQKNNPNGYDD